MEVTTGLEQKVLHSYRKALLLWYEYQMTMQSGLMIYLYVFVGSSDLVKVFFPEWSSSSLTVM